MKSDTGYDVFVKVDNLNHHMSFAHPDLEDVLAEALKNAPKKAVPPERVVIKPKIILAPLKEEVIHLENGMRVRVNRKGQVKAGH